MVDNLFILINTKTKGICKYFILKEIKLNIIYLYQY